MHRALSEQISLCEPSALPASLTPRAPQALLPSGAVNQPSPLRQSFRGSPSTHWKTPQLAFSPTCSILADSSLDLTLSISPYPIPAVDASSINKAPRPRPHCFGRLGELELGRSLRLLTSCGDLICISSLHCATSDRYTFEFHKGAHL
jgi:hypothetical protein